MTLSIITLLSLPAAMWAIGIIFARPINCALINAGFRDLPSPTKLVAQNSSNTHLIKVSSAHVTVNGIPGIYEVFNDPSLPTLDDPSGDDTHAVDKRCGSNQIRCDYHNWQARVEICAALIEKMRGDSYLNAPPFSQKCYHTTDLLDNNLCCVTWPRQIHGVKFGMLLGAAQASLDKCKTADSGLVGAYASDVKFKNTCTAQCLSNQREGCLE